MFVETRREGEIEAPTISLTGLIAWMETKDPKETYVFVDARICANLRVWPILSVNGAAAATMVERRRSGMGASSFCFVRRTRRKE